jgi:hypothetical protein
MHKNVAHKILFTFSDCCLFVYVKTKISQHGSLYSVYLFIVVCFFL